MTLQLLTFQSEHIIAGRSVTRHAGHSPHPLRRVCSLTTTPFWNDAIQNRIFELTTLDQTIVVGIVPAEELSKEGIGWMYIKGDEELLEFIDIHAMIKVFIILLPDSVELMATSSFGAFM
jgi:hypothetical protein